MFKLDTISQTVMFLGYYISNAATNNNTLNSGIDNFGTADFQTSAGGRRDFGPMQAHANRGRVKNRHFLRKSFKDDPIWYIRQDG